MQNQRNIPIHAARILVVDDETLMLDFLTSALTRKLGCHVYPFQEIEEAFHFLEEHEVDVIISDLRMAEMDGISFLATVQKKHPQAVQLLISGYADKENTIRAINELENLHAVIEKPVKVKPLIFYVQHAYEKRYLSQLLEQQIKELQEVNQRLRITQNDLLIKNQQAAIGEFIQGICHNINTPLGLILGHIEMLEMKFSLAEDKKLSREEIQKSLNYIKNGAQRIDRIVKNLLSKSRMEQESGRKELSLNELLRQELEFLKADPFLKHKVEVIWELDDALPKVKINYADFSQIFANLTKNALDALNETSSPKIKLRTGVEKEFLFFEIHDNGPGIPEELKEKIFDPFFTTKGNKDFADMEEPPDTPIGFLSSKKPTGTGLGLHSCRKILEPYGGYLSLIPSSLGGAAFRVELPLSSSRKN